MAAERILLTGKIVAGGEIAWRIAPLVDEYAEARRNGTGSFTGSLPGTAQDYGAALYEAGFLRSACRGEDEVIGYDCAEWDAQQAAMIPLQQLIDYAAELQELQDGMDDDEFNRRGC